MRPPEVLGDPRETPSARPVSPSPPRSTRPAHQTQELDHAVPEDPELFIAVFEFPAVTPAPLPRAHFILGLDFQLFPFLFFLPGFCFRWRLTSHRWLESLASYGLRSLDRPGIRGSLGVYQPVQRPCSANRRGGQGQRLCPPGARRSPAWPRVGRPCASWIRLAGCRPGALALVRSATPGPSPALQDSPRPVRPLLRSGGVGRFLGLPRAVLLEGQCDFTQGNASEQTCSQRDGSDFMAARTLDRATACEPRRGAGQ